MTSPVTAQSSFSDIFSSWNLPSEDMSRMMASRLLATDRDNRPEYDALRDSLRQDCKALVQKLAALPHSLIAKMDGLLERAREKDSAMTSAQFAQETQELAQESDSAMKALKNGAIDIPRLRNRIWQLDQAEERMAQSGLVFGKADEAFLAMLDAAAGKLQPKQILLRECSATFSSETGLLLVQIQAQEKRAAWKAVFNYIAHGDPAGPGLSAPPRAQFRKKTPAP